jgi:hypothetical protein
MVMRKTLIGVLVTALLSVATPVAAEEITMVCKYKDLTRTLKYVAPLIGKKKILQRKDGKWVDWDRPRKDHYKQPQLTITERAAVMKFVMNQTADRDYENDNVKKGDESLWHFRVVSDFEFITSEEKIWMSRMDGSALVKGKTERDPDKPKIERYKCKKHEPN